MKKLLISCVLITVPALAQSVVRFDSNVTTTASNVPINAQAAVLTVPNATVTVCGFPAAGIPCTNTVPIFQDQAMTVPLNNPLTTDPKGRFGFWLASGQYSYSVQNQNGQNLGNYPLTLYQGAPGNAIIAAPSASQTVTQPAGTTFTPNSQDFVLYADKCIGTDIGMKINACAALLPLSGGYHVGTILLPNTMNMPADAAWATTVNLGPGVNLTGQGLLASKFNCTVAGDCLLYDASAPEHGGSSHAFTVGVASVLQGFTVIGNGTSGQNIFHLKDATNLTLRDVAADGATAAGSACFLLHDVTHWTERDTFNNVSSLFGCAIGWRFIADTGNPFQPHPSFGYNRFENIKANPNNGQTAFSFEGNSFVFSGTYRITVNGDGPGNKVFHMQDGAQFFLNELHFNGETSSGTGLLFDITSAANQFTWFGDFVFGGGLTNNLATGATVTHYLDSAGFAPAFENKTQYSISSIYAQDLGTGRDLNTIVNCGKYEGSAATNTPLGIGNQIYRLEVLCGGQGVQFTYLTQIIYAAQFNFGGINRVFYRVRDNSAWYPWRQLAFTSDLPTAGITQALPGAAITAGACANLSAVINNASGNMAVAATPNSTTQLISGLHWDTAYISATSGPLMLTNDPAGTSANHIAKQSANGKALTATISDIAGLLGVCTSGCGISGTATIATTGTASVLYDNATVAGDFVINSTTIAGAAHDFGPSPIGVPSQILGQVQTTNASAGTYATTIEANAPSSATVTVPVCNTTSSSITPNITPTFNVRLIP